MLGKDAKNVNVERCMDFSSNHPNCEWNNDKNNNNDNKSIATMEKRVMKQ